MYGQREVIISSLQLLLAYLAQSQWGASQFSSVQSLSRVRLFATPWDCSASGFPVHHQLQSLLKIMSIESVMPSNHLTLCHSLRSSPASGSLPMSWLFPSGGQSIGSSASVLPMKIQGWFPLGLTGLISLQSKGLSRVFSSTTIRKHQFFGSQSSLWFNSHVQI